MGNIPDLCSLFVSIFNPRREMGALGISEETRKRGSSCLLVQAVDGHIMMVAWCT